MKRLTRALLALTCLGALAACGDDVNTSTDPVEVEVGEAFEWNGFTVDDGWEINGIDRAVNMEEVTTPEVKGTITNTLEEERTAIFEMVFSADGEPVATLSCSAASNLAGQDIDGGRLRSAARHLSSGLSSDPQQSELHRNYDAVVVQELVR